MELIGKGLFSKVYKFDKKRVLIKSVCLAKECNSLFVDSIWFPKLEQIGENEYLCEYYPKVTSLKSALKPKHYELYKELRSINVYCHNERDYYFKLREEFCKVSNKSLRTALIEFLDDFNNYGTDMGFEISPRNVAVKNGRLILLDCFFNRKQLREVRKNGTGL